MEAPTSPAIPQYIGCCASNYVVVRTSSSRVGVYVQLRGTQVAVRRENPTPRDSVQRMHEERLPDVNSLRPVNQPDTTQIHVSALYRGVVNGGEPSVHAKAKNR